MSALSPEQRFEVGEIAILNGAHVHPNWSRYVGTECTVLQLPDIPPPYPVYEYFVSLCDGRRAWVSRHDLIKKRPPREDLKVVLWDECPWQPESIRV